METEKTPANEVQTLSKTHRRRWQHEIAIGHLHTHIAVWKPLKRGTKDKRFERVCIYEDNRKEEGQKTQRISGNQDGRQKTAKSSIGRRQRGCINKGRIVLLIWPFLLNLSYWTFYKGRIVLLTRTRGGGGYWVLNKRVAIGVSQIYRPASWLL